MQKIFLPEKKPPKKLIHFFTGYTQSFGSQLPTRFIWWYSL